MDVDIVIVVNIIIIDTTVIVRNKGRVTRLSEVDALRLMCVAMCGTIAAFMTEVWIGDARCKCGE